MKILNDDAAQQSLKDNGFAVVNLLNQQDILDFKKVYDFYKASMHFINDIHITFEHSDNKLRREISTKLTQMGYDKFSSVLDDFKILHGNFFIKLKQSNINHVPIHTDWTVVDQEGGAESYVLWVTLSDITKEMGGIGVIRGSHKEFNYLNHIFPRDKDRYSANMYKYIEKKEIEYIEVKAGQAIIWNNKLLHQSAPNFSLKDRVNMTFLIANKSDQLKLLWYRKDTNELSLYNVPDDFYCVNNVATLSEYYNSNTIPENAVLDTSDK